MILGFVYPDPICGEPDTRPWVVSHVHYMYFAMFSFFSTGLLMCGVSLCSEPPTEDQIRGLTFWTRKEESVPSANAAIYSAPLGGEVALSPLGDDASPEAVDKSAIPNDDDLGT